MNVTILSGCTPTPLMGYLKGLGIFRIVAEQADPEARVSWEADQLILRTKLTKAELVQFFLQRYAPSAILAPWNGGSGFFPGDNQKALEAFSATAVPRFRMLRECIQTSRSALERLDLKAKPEKESKRLLLELLRNQWPDEALHWLDAVAVIAGGEVRFPPLIGTGGNDGRLEFTNNFLQRLAELFLPESGDAAPDSEIPLANALFAAPAPVCVQASVGQFSPGTAGGANNATGFDGNASINPWDFVMMLEGTLLFAASCSRRFDQQSSAVRALAFPFCVRATGAGYTGDSLVEAKQARAEIWLPTWTEPLKLAQVRALFNEGRAQISGRPARTGLEFALALGSFGVDRGLDAFFRYGFLVRNGLAYFAVATDRFAVKRNPQVPLILEIRDWMDRLERAANSTKPPPPNSVPPVLLSVQRAIIAHSHQPQDRQRFQDILIALGEAEKQLNRTLSWSRDTANIPPLSAMSMRWRAEADNGTAEYRLAAALASAYVHFPDEHRYFPFRCFVEHVAPRKGERLGRMEWLDQRGREAVWSQGGVVDSMLRALERLLLLHGRERLSRWSLVSASPAKLDDLDHFISDAFDFTYFEQCLLGLILLRWRQPMTGKDEKPTHRDTYRRLPPTLYALLKLCLAGHPVGGTTVRIQADIFRLAASGDARRATESAITRLRASGLPTVVKEGLFTPTEQVRQAAAALIFPVDAHAVAKLATTFLHLPLPDGEDALSGSAPEPEVTPKTTIPV